MTRTPPGPRWPRFVQAYLLTMRTNRFVRWAHRRYGDIFTTWFLSPVDRKFERFVCSADAGDARSVFSGSPALFHAGENNAFLQPVLGERSVLAAILRRYHVTTGDQRPEREAIKFITAVSPSKGGRVRLTRR